LKMPLLGSAGFGVRTFYAASHPNDKCGPNGLPLTPNSVKILGRFQFMKTLYHPRLCQYLDISKTKHECMQVVSEHYDSSLKHFIQTQKDIGESDIVRVGYQVLDGLCYLHDNRVVHRNLSLDNILLDSENNVKLSEFGIYYITDFGANVSFPVGLPKYMAPEVLCSGPVKTEEDTGKSILPQSGPKVDSWTFGLILLELVLGKELWEGLDVKEILLKVVEFIKSDMAPIDVLQQDPAIAEKLRGVSMDLRDVLRLCLTVQTSKRVKPTELKQHPLFRSERTKKVSYKKEFLMCTTELRCKDLELPTYEETIEKEFSDDHLSQRSMAEVFYLWKLAGGDVEAVLRKAGLAKTKVPVHLLPCLGIREGEVFGQDRDLAELLDYTVIPLSQDQLRYRLRDIPPTAYYPLLEDDSKSTEGQGSMTHSTSSGELTSSATLPLIIREKDVEYQFHRVILYDRLILAYPFKRSSIYREARVDIPPLVRANVWAAILGVEGDVQGIYNSIDKETPTSTDRQIEVDIPRCHQYHELLSSPTAHAKFKRVLKAWVISNPQYVYWQGLDSLCAPFLALNFNNEAQAFACLSAFIPKYLHKFFMRDNSAVIQEYLAVFSQMIAFHDPELSNHLDGIGFIPDLYAIPWFLTMYAHVFPLHKIVHLWDTLLLGNSSFPLYIGVAILAQLRDRLLSFGFNECILLFSDMPETDIERCVKDSIKIFKDTPKSACYREHAGVPKTSEEERPTLSYYTRDYHEQPRTELSREPIPLEELKADKVPRISAEDLIELAELAGVGSSRSPTKKRQSSKPEILIVDVRMADDFRRGTLQGAVNIPFQTAFSPEGELNPCPAVQILNASRGKIIAVIGNRGRNASNFANELVRLDYALVCVLHKGLDVFRTTGLITVPPVDL